MQHPKLIAWEKRLKGLFDEIDNWLEDHYGSDYPLHPNRAARGETANVAMDGLFNIGAYFTSGFGSQLGRGYIIKMRMSTLADIPEEVRENIKRDIERLVAEKLPEVFPDRKLNLERDGDLLKIIGDFSLGSVIQT